VRGDGGTLKNTEGKRFMFNYIPDFFKAETADTEKEADAWYEDKRNNRCTAGFFSTSPRAVPPIISRNGSRPCTISSKSWPTWTLPKNRWKWVRPAITRWAACG